MSPFYWIFLKICSFVIGPYVTAELAQPLPMPLSKLLENTAVVRSELSLALTDQSIDTLPSFETAGSSCVVTPNRSMGVASYQTAVSQQSSPDGENENLIDIPSEGRLCYGICKSGFDFVYVGGGGEGVALGKKIYCT